jgi:hypothetical protein
MVTQKEAVYVAITSVLAEHNITFEEGMDVGPIMTKELRAIVNTILFQGFRNNQIQLEREFNDSDLKAYVSGLQSNWIRKDSRLNGNTKYQAKNPGSRQGVTDPQIKAMRALLTTLTKPEDKAEVEAEIAKRQAELNKAKAPTIDFSALPASLRAKFQR